MSQIPLFLLLLCNHFLDLTQAGSCAPPSIETAVQYFQSGQFEESIYCFEEAYTDARDIGEAVTILNNLMAVLHRAGKVARAESTAWRAIQLLPSSSKSWHNLALILQEQKRFNESLVAHRHAVLLARETVRAHMCSADPSLRKSTVAREACDSILKSMQMLYFYRRAVHEFTGQQEGDTEVLRILHHISPYAVDKIFFDVGANKGSFFEQVFDLWGLLPLLRFVKKFGIEHIRPILRRTVREPPPEMSPTVYAFEANPATHQLLVETTAGEYPPSSLRLINMAVSNVTGATVPLYDGYDTTIGNEYATLHSRGGIVAIVPTVTLDDFIEAENITARHGTIFYVKVDVEGYEPQALQGLRRTLTAQLIDFLQFEVNGEWAKSGATLRQHVDLLDSLGYDSYFIGNRNLLALTPTSSMWDEVFSFDVWCNILAVRRSHPLHRLFLDAFNQEVPACDPGRCSPEELFNLSPVASTEDMMRVFGNPFSRLGPDFSLQI